MVLDVAKSHCVTIWLSGYSLREYALWHQAIRPVGLHTPAVVL